MHRNDDVWSFKFLGDRFYAYERKGELTPFEWEQLQIEDKPPRSFPRGGF